MVADDDADDICGRRGQTVLVGLLLVLAVAFLPQTMKAPRVEYIVRSRQPIGDTAVAGWAQVASTPELVTPAPTPSPATFPAPAPATPAVETTAAPTARSPTPVTPAQQTDRWFVCDDYGKVLPIWYAALEKAGSQTLYEDLKPVLRGPNNCAREKALYCKEIHYFEKYYKAGRPYNQWFGDCSTYKKGRVVSDFTPSHFYWHGNAARVKSTYGSKYQEIVLQLGLRDPLSRTMSAFTDSIARKWGVYRKPHRNFAEHIDSFFKSWDSVGDPQKWINDPSTHPEEFRTVDQSLYYYCIRRYLDQGFLASQFIVYPATEYLKHRDNLDTNPVLQAARSMLGPNTLRLPPGVGISTAGANRNKGHHKRIEEELTESVRMRLLNEVYEPANKKLMQLLAEESQHGMILAGYTGEVGNVAAITEWMTSGWKF